MENKSILIKLKSRYIVEKINSFINDENFIFKLIVHSKSLQKKLNIGLLDYQEKYFKKRFNFEYYFYHYESLNNLLLNDFYKDKLDKKILLTLIIYHLIKKLENNNNNKLYNYENYINIDFDNPFFEFFLKNKNFENSLNFNIDLENMEKYNLKDKYISNFEKLNKSNIKYTSLYFYIKNINNINYLKDFKIEFNENKNLSFNEYYNDNNCYNIDTFFTTLISFDNIINNLVYLYLYFSENKKINTNIFKKINEFKSLKYLELANIELSDSFLLKLTNLEKLHLACIKNINLNDNIFNNNNLIKLKDLLIYNCYISKPKSNFLLKCPEVESLYLKFFDEDKENYGEYNLILDFSSFKKLKNFIGDSENFIFLENNISLEEVYLDDYKDISDEIEKKNLESICSIKSLKFIDLSLKKIYGEDISDIKNINTSVTKMKINLDYNHRCNILYEIQQKFPNLEDLYIRTFDQIFGGDAEFEIKEKSDCKIKKIKIDLKHYYEVKFFCISYEKLESVKINIDYKDNINMKLENSFPIFNMKCNILFKSLTIFKFTGYEFIRKNIINNIYNNIDNMPNLINFKFECNTNEDINEDFYNKFIIKILSLKFIKKIKIFI